MIDSVSQQHANHILIKLRSTKGWFMKKYSDYIDGSLYNYFREKLEKDIKLVDTLGIPVEVIEIWRKQALQNSIDFDMDFKSKNYYRRKKRECLQKNLPIFGGVNWDDIFSNIENKVEHYDRKLKSIVCRAKDVELKYEYELDRSSETDIFNRFLIEYALQCSLDKLYMIRSFITNDYLEKEFLGEFVAPKILAEIYHRKEEAKKTDCCSDYYASNQQFFKAKSIKAFADVDVVIDAMKPTIR